jgi:hypothetical protein
MKPRIISIALTLGLALCLFGGISFAATVFSTGFDGNSGGVPAGWTDIGFDTAPQSTVIESGGVVAVTDFRPATGNSGGPQLIQSDFAFTASSESTATVMLDVDIASITTDPAGGDTDAIVALGSFSSSALVVVFHTETNTFGLAVAQGGSLIGDFSLPAGPHLPDYAGDSLSISLALDADSVRLTSGGFDSGHLLYTASGAPGLDSLDDLGAGVSVVLGVSVESSGDRTSTVNFNSVLLDISGTSNAYNFTGFFSPVDNPPVVNQVKAGQAIPVKFSLGGDQGLNIFASGYPKSQTINCSTSAPIDDIEETVTAGNSSLSYDPASDRYNYVWKTEKGWAGQCRQLIVRFADGSPDKIAYFKFK